MDNVLAGDVDYGVFVFFEGLDNRRAAGIGLGGPAMSSQDKSQTDDYGGG